MRWFNFSASFFFPYKHTYIHINTHSLFHSLTHSHTHSLTLSTTSSLSLPPSLPISFSHSLTLSLTLSISHSTPTHTTLTHSTTTHTHTRCYPCRWSHTVYLLIFLEKKCKALQIQTFYRRFRDRSKFLLMHCTAPFNGSLRNMKLGES